MCIVRNALNDKFEFDNLCLEDSKEKVVLGLQLTVNRKAGRKFGALLRITI